MTEGPVSCAVNVPFGSRPSTSYYLSTETDAKHPVTARRRGGSPTVDALSIGDAELSSHWENPSWGYYAGISSVSLGAVQGICRPP
jgi:hypothetical protein